MRPIVLADGTYATQTAVDTANVGTSTPNLRALLLSDDFFLAAICGGTMDQARFEVHEKQYVLGRGKEPNASGGYVVHCGHVALENRMSSHMRWIHDSTERLSRWPL